MPLQTVAGSPIWQISMGIGPNKAMLLHCGLAHSGAWAGMASKLNDVLDATAIDLPGHGQSGDWDGRGDYQARVCEILAEMLDEPTDLIGHSFGGTVALRMAVERPNLVHSLTLIEPVYFAAAKGTDAFKRHSADYRAFAGALMAGDRITAARAFTANWGTGDAWESLSEQQRTYVTDRIHLIAETSAAVYDDVAGILAPGRLEQVKVPALLIDGSDSPPVIDAVQSSLAKRLPDTRRVTIEGAGHMVPVTHPIEVAAAIREFLS